MKIGIIAPPWLPVPPRRYGGTENVIDGLCRGLQAQGHDVILVAPMGSRCQGVTVVPLRVGQQGDLGMGHAVVEAPYALRAYEELAQAAVDVIHDHTQVGFLLADRSQIGQPIVTTNHNLFDAARCKIYEEAARWRGIQVVAISKHHASTAPGVPIVGFVHNGVDVANIPVGNGDGGYAMVLSRMSPAKGILEAILMAKQAHMPLKIAAKMQTPAEQRYFRDEIYEHIGGDIEFESEVGTEKYKLLGEAVALLNPIQWDEPFGLAMAEALACGTPVLSTLRGAAPEIVEHGSTGFLRNHWSQLVSDLGHLDNIDRAVCRQVAEERFSIARMAAGYLELYRAAIGQEVAA